MSASDLGARPAVSRTPSGATYSLCQDVHFGLSGTFAAFLSLTQDRYRCVRRDALERAGMLLRGWPLDRTAGIADVSAQRLCEALLAQGVLTCSMAHGKAVVPTRTVRATRDCNLAAWAPRRRIWLGRGRRPFGCAMSALVRADSHLRRRPLVETVARVQWDDEELTGLGSGVAGLLAVRARVEEFQSLRPLYWRPYRCLLDSLALKYFLQEFGLRVTWMFGVCAEPFQAHCWLQRNEVVLNDSLERVAAYTPVLAV